MMDTGARLNTPHRNESEDMECTEKAVKFMKGLLETKELTRRKNSKVTMTDILINIMSLLSIYRCMYSLDVKDLNSNTLLLVGLIPFISGNTDTDMIKKQMSGFFSMRHPICTDPSSASSEDVKQMIALSIILLMTSMHCSLYHPNDFIWQIDEYCCNVIRKKFLGPFSVAVLIINSRKYKYLDNFKVEDDFQSLIEKLFITIWDETKYRITADENTMMFTTDIVLTLLYIIYSKDNLRPLFNSLSKKFGNAVDNALSGKQSDLGRKISSLMFTFESTPTGSGHLSLMRDELLRLRFIVNGSLQYTMCDQTNEEWVKNATGMKFEAYFESILDPSMTVDQNTSIREKLCRMIDSTNRIHTTDPNDELHADAKCIDVSGHDEIPPEYCIRLDSQIMVYAMNAEANMTESHICLLHCSNIFNKLHPDVADSIHKYAWECRFDENYTAVLFCIIYHFCNMCLSETELSSKIAHLITTPTIIPSKRKSVHEQYQLHDIVGIVYKRLLDSAVIPGTQFNKDEYALKMKRELLMLVKSTSMIGLQRIETIDKVNVDVLKHSLEDAMSSTSNVMFDFGMSSDIPSNILVKIVNAAKCVGRSNTTCVGTQKLMLAYSRKNSDEIMHMTHLDESLEEYDEDGSLEGDEGGEEEKGGNSEDESSEKENPDNSFGYNAVDL